MGRADHNGGERARESVTDEGSRRRSVPRRRGEVSTVCASVEENEGGWGIAPYMQRKCVRERYGLRPPACVVRVRTATRQRPSPPESVHEYTTVDDVERTTLIIDLWDANLGEFETLQWLPNNSCAFGSFILENRLAQASVRRPPTPDSSLLLLHRAPLRYCARGPFLTPRNGQTDRPTYVTTLHAVITATAVDGRGPQQRDGRVRSESAHPGSETGYGAIVSRPYFFNVLFCTHNTSRLCSVVSTVRAYRFIHRYPIG